ncbi:MAG TPA: CBS domain-containing protein [Solirubrobacteraceae bacterium]|jgi:CBS domain-containing protein|nr:CBS domain-containing protein [Solirubrobacteraceae bacterium]
MGKTAREVMTGGAECIGEKETIEQAAKKLAEIDVGAMPICGEDDRLHGMLTDRDIVVKVIAKGKDPAQMSAGELATQDEVVTIGADDSVDEALRTMAENKVRRLPVIDGHKLIGVVSQADLAAEIDSERVGELIEAISAAP